ncbi:MAG: alpha/beta fold hydrolase [Desulfobacteraceae bacterium]|jgi:alpha-beta hydrolase superfamily lysophospholipase
MTKIECINFLSEDYLLHGILHLPDIPSPPVVIGCHGLLANCDSPKQIALAQSCVDMGIAYFRFDHRGCGKSQGEFEKVTNLSARCTDLKNAIETIVKKVNCNQPVGLFGSSLGGAVCLAVASEIETGPKVVIATPLSTHNLTPPPRSKASEPPYLSDRFYKDNLIFDLQDKLHKINNILIIHGNMDAVVPVSNAHQLYAQAGLPKKIIIQKNGDHSISTRKHQKEFQLETIKWIQNGFDSWI